jgi:hypothetical protein
MGFGLESAMRSVETCHRDRPNDRSASPQRLLARQFLPLNRFARCQPASEFELKITRHPGTLNEVASDGEVFAFSRMLPDRISGSNHFFL